MAELPDWLRMEPAPEEVPIAGHYWVRFQWCSQAVIRKYFSRQMLSSNIEEIGSAPIPEPGSIFFVDGEDDEEPTAFERGWEAGWVSAEVRDHRLTEIERRLEALEGKHADPT